MLKCFSDVMLHLEPLNTEVINVLFFPRLLLRNTRDLFILFNPWLRRCRRKTKQEQWICHPFFLSCLSCRLKHPRFLGSSTGYQSKPGEAFSSPLFLSRMAIASADSQSIHRVSDNIHCVEDKQIWLILTFNDFCAVMQYPMHIPVSYEKIEA